MNVSIDPYAGFCYGVEKAVELAESALKHQKTLHCLGDLVHNPGETQRLEALGLNSLSYEQFESLKDQSLMIRAHGEPPETYEKAGQKNIKLMDATCPIVLKLQQRIYNAYIEMKAIGGTVVLLGKKNHPEVIGLLGQTEGRAVVVETEEDLNTINYSRPIRVFTQTTLDPGQFLSIEKKLLENANRSGSAKDQLEIYNTICGHVKNRIPRLKSFCSQNEVIVFVSGPESSNGKALFQICKQINPSSYFISGPEELDQRWFANKTSVGISGATSTPAWLMQKVAEKLKD
jgi:4-hydroxy-3-methylbut-2-enyl diphosphate reductase